MFLNGCETDNTIYLGLESAKRSRLSDTLLTLQMVTAGNGLSFSGNLGDSNDVKTGELSNLSHSFQQKNDENRTPLKQMRSHIIL